MPTPSELARYDQDLQASEDQLDRLLAGMRRAVEVPEFELFDSFIVAAAQMSPAQLVSALWTCINRLRKL